MKTASTKIIVSVFLFLIFLVSCSNSDPKDVKREVAGEAESINVAKDFIKDVIDYNQDHDKDLTLTGDYTQFWNYIHEEGLTKQLSSTILSAQNYGDSEWSKIANFYDTQLKPLINYLYGYDNDDFIYAFNGSLGDIEVRIKPEAIDKGIYLQNDPSEAVFAIYVERVKGDGVKVVSIYTEEPKAVENKYLWIAKEGFQDYIAQIKSQIEDQNRLLENQQQEEAEQATLEAQAQAKQEEEQKQLELAQEEQDRWRENQQQSDEKCSEEKQYSDALITFTYDGCTVISGSLETDKAMTISRAELEYDSFGDPFTIEITAKDNTTNISITDFDSGQYDYEYASLFGDYGFVHKQNMNSSGDSSEVLEGIIADGSQLVTVTFLYKGDIRPTRGETLLFNSLRFN